MTDKEIIIDGVYVSGCGFFHPECGDYSCHIALAFPDEYTDADNAYFKCEQNPNCTYKQLARKTKECEKLKEKWSIGFQKFCDKDNELQAEKQRVKELEQEIENTKEAIFNANYDFVENARLDYIIDGILHSRALYLQALKDIKKIATDLRTRRDYHSPDEVNSDIDKILQIIEELI